MNDQSGRECVSIDVIVRPPEIIAHKDERIPFLPASAVAGQQVFEVVLLLLLLIKLQKQEKHCINSQKQLIYHRAAIFCILLICFSCLFSFVFLVLVQAAKKYLKSEKHMHA